MLPYDLTTIVIFLSIHSYLQLSFKPVYSMPLLDICVLYRFDREPNLLKQFILLCLPLFNSLQVLFKLSFPLLIILTQLFQLIYNLQNTLLQRHMHIIQLLFHRITNNQKSMSSVLSIIIKIQHQSCHLSLQFLHLTLQQLIRVLNFVLKICKSNLPVLQRVLILQLTKILTPFHRCRSHVFQIKRG